MRYKCFYIFIAIFGRGQGSTKRIAETTCALSIVRQLFHIGFLNKFIKFISILGALPSSSNKQPSNKKLNANNVCNFISFKY